MTTPLNPDCWTSLDWAKLKIERIESELKEWSDKQNHTQPITFRREFDPDALTFSFVVDTIDVEMPWWWSPLLGDALNNFRSALDYLAWQLVKVGRTPDTARPWFVQFPIYSDEAVFDSNLDRRLPGVDKRHRTLIREHQPFRLGEAKSGDPLAILADLNRINKHRNLHVMLVQPGTLISRVLNVRGFIVKNRRVFGFDPLKPGAPVLVFEGEIDSSEGQPHMEVDIQLTPAIAFENSLHVTHIANEMGKAVARVLRDFDPIP